MVVHTDETGDDTVAVQSNTWASLGTFADASSETDSMFPLEITTVWSSRAAAPVPSITRTWVRAITGASAFTMAHLGRESLGHESNRASKHQEDGNGQLAHDSSLRTQGRILPKKTKSVATFQRLKLIAIRKDHGRHLPLPPCFYAQNAEAALAVVVTRSMAPEISSLAHPRSGMAAFKCGRFSPCTVCL
jgi:hypothetical protein